MSRLRVAVVGGGIGLQHLAAFRDLPDQFEIAALVDPDPERRALGAKLFEIPQLLESLDEALELEGLDVVDVCTPPHLHGAMIRSGLAAGKHVICEKPLVGSLAECDEVARWEADAPGRLMPIFQYRFGRGLQKLRHLAAHGVLGRCYTASVETAWKRDARYYAVDWRGKWRTERGGALLSHAIHNHDILCYVLGPVRSVFASTATRVNPIETEDCAAVTLEMCDGSLASLSVTLGSQVEISRLRFCFENVTAESSLAPYTPGNEPWTFTPAGEDQAARIADALASFEPEPEYYAGQFARFHRALASGGELPVTLTDARASLELVTAMYTSARSRAAVSLPLSPESDGYSSWLPPEARDT
jgi:predicted dehydrogenase